MRDPWREATVGEIADLGNERVDPRSLAPDTILHHYSIPALDDLGHAIDQPAEEIKSHKYMVRHDSVLVSLLNPRIPRFWMAAGSDRSVCSTEFAVLRPRPEWVEIEYLGLLVSSASFWSSLGGLVAGTTGSRQRVKPLDLLRLPVRIPPTSVQRQIVDVIGSATSVVDASQVLREETLTAQFSVLADLIREFAISSPVARLDGLMAHVIGGAWGSEPGVEGQDVLALGPAVFADGAIEVDPSRGSTRSLAETRVASRALMPGDIVLERSGGSDDQPVGRVVICREEFTTPVVPSDFMRLLRVDSALADPEYVYWVLRIKYLLGDTRHFSAKTTSIWNLRIPDYLTSEIPLPHRAEQERFASVAWEFADACEQARVHHGSALRVRASLLADLLSGDHAQPHDYFALVESE